MYKLKCLRNFFQSELVNKFTKFLILFPKSSHTVQSIINKLIVIVIVVKHRNHPDMRKCLSWWFVGLITMNLATSLFMMDCIVWVVNRFWKEKGEFGKLVYKFWLKKIEVQYFGLNTYINIINLCKNSNVYSIYITFLFFFSNYFTKIYFLKKKIKKWKIGLKPFRTWNYVKIGTSRF